MNPLNAVISLPEASELPEEVKNGLKKGPAGDIFPWNGKLYTQMSGQIFQSEDTPEGRGILEAISRGEKQERGATRVRSLADAWKRGLIFSDPEALRDLMETYQVRDQKPRCVLLFRGRQEGDALRLATMAELVPKEETDPLISLSETEIALIRGAEDLTVEDETEYAQAVVEFAESEMGLSLTAGVGSPRDRLAELSESYQEAAEALRIGRQFHLSEHVHVYQKQILERLLAAVPEAERAAARRQIFNERTQKLLNDEMRETIRAFFENDLNLSTTARQLYLHRNTLTYRLDRIRKETGLDLRSFKDAAAFKAIMECPAEDDSGK